MDHVGVLGGSIDKRDEMPLYCKSNVTIDDNVHQRILVYGEVLPTLPDT